MPNKNESPDNTPDDAFAEQSAGLRTFADLLDEYPDANDTEQKRIAGELHLTAPRTADAVKQISKYLEKTHG